MKDRIKLTDLQPQRQNANSHTPRGMKALEESIQQDGWIGAITIAADGETFDGSARLEVGASTGFEDAIVVETDGRIPVIVKRVDIPSADDERARRLGIGANRIAQLNLKWDAAVLSTIDREDGLASLLFRPDEVQSIRLDDQEKMPYTPNYMPSGVVSETTAADMKQAQESLERRLKDERALLPIVCPHCAGEFFLHKADI